LGVWSGGEGRALRGQKYRGKLRNLSHFLKEYFLSDKLMLMINIFLILRIL
jgi:hypothetical protein